MSLREVQEFLFLCMVLNIGLLMFSSILIIVIRPFVCRMHGKMFGVSEERIAFALYGYLGAYKIAVIVFNVVPWLALFIMTSRQ